MKRCQVYVSLLLLVALFFIVYPLQTTYAYFTDQTSVSGNLSLKTGTLSLADIAASSLTFKTETELPATTIVKNTGSLDGKLTVKEISAIQAGNPVNYTDYFDVYVAFDNSNITASSTRNMTVTVTKKKDWEKEQPIELAIPVRINQTNVTGDQSGFIDQKIYRISLTNNSVEMPEWPKFEDNGYIAQPLYHSVVDGKLTTVVPGIVYLKSDVQLANPKEFFETHIKISERQPIISKIDYIPTKGYRLEITHSRDESHNLTDMIAMRIQFVGDYVQIKYAWGENAFSRAFIMDSELRGDEPFYTLVSETIEVNLLSSSPINRGYTSFNNEGGKKSLTGQAKEYIKNQLSICTTRDSHLKATFITSPIDKAYSGIQLSLGNANIQAYKGEKFQLVNKTTKKVVFERKVEHVPGEKELLKEESTTETRQESSSETSQTSTSSGQKDSMDFSTLEELETTNTETTENSTLKEESELITESTEWSQENQGADSVIFSEVRLEESVTSSSSEMSSEEEQLLKE